MNEQAAFAKAIEYVGGKSALARLLGIKRQAIQQWARVPATHAYAIERATKGRVKCHELRPDLFPRASR
jgi:DNA-binding transcriptional regulator YdaS (Cro superfamily)